MNDVELMQGKVAALCQRMSAIEDKLSALAKASADGIVALEIVRELGFPVDILYLPAAVPERRALAADLRRRGWSQARIARVLNCCERTIERWTGVPTGAQSGI